MITGNTGVNTLTGNDGNDTLNGGTGADALVGGLGDDTYAVDNAGDTVTENASEGTDTVQSTVTRTLGNHQENLTLTGGSAINATGNSLNNVLTGNTGANTLDGSAGMDTMAGGSGNDIYVVDDAGDVVTENANQGTDTVQSSLTYTLGSNVENLTLTGSSALDATGNTLNNVLTGNSGVNALTAGDGNDTLDGGSGADTLVGGTGDDTYVVDHASDVVTENASEGIDTVQSSITYTLGSTLENLTLTGSSGINGTGNSLDNVLTGNTGANTLTGGDGNDTLNGGTGADALTGGTGNDNYVIDNASDSVTENASEGTDTVQSSITYTLGSDVENLTLTGSSGLTGTGNALGNVLTGNTGANTLNGGAGNDAIDGGTGNDTMVGGTGDDTYSVNATGDVVTESAAEGTDTILSGVTYTASANVENLSLTGTGSINATGNALNNTLNGHTGANTLSGLGGDDVLEGKTGSDSMTGGDGADVYRYSSGDGTDTIDNSSGDSATDRLLFTNLARTQLSFAQSGNDLVISRVGSGSDSVRVTGWFSASGNRIDIVETTGGQTTTADEIDTLIGGGGGSFPNAFAPPPEFLMARPPSEFEWAVLSETAQPSRAGIRQRQPLPTLETEMAQLGAAMGLSDSTPEFVPGFRELQRLVVQPRTLWDDMQSVSSRPYTPIWALVETPPKLVVCNLVEQPSGKEPRRDLRIGAPLEQPPSQAPRVRQGLDTTFERLVSAIAAFDNGAEVLGEYPHLTQVAGESLTGVDLRGESPLWTTSAPKGGPRHHPID